MRVYIYYNLHSGQWSVRSRERDTYGKVLGHCRVALLSDAEFRVSEAGRQRVLREQKKNVHAGVAGTLLAWSDGRVTDTGAETELVSLPSPEDYSCTLGDIVTYNPYKYRSFVLVRNEEPVVSASHLFMIDRTVQLVTELEEVG